MDLSESTMNHIFLVVSWNGNKSWSVAVSVKH
jgi:hypothetical protein